MSASDGVTFAGWMIVHDNHGAGGGYDGESKHFAGMHQNGIHCANRNKLVAFDALARVK